MAISAASRVLSGFHAAPVRRDGIPDRMSNRANRDQLQLSAPLSLVVEGVRVGEPIPVKVKKMGITVRGTAVVGRMSKSGSEFGIHIRDSVFGKKIEKDVSVSVDSKPEGGYRFTKVEDGKSESGDVAQVRVKGSTTTMQVPDAEKGGRMTEIRFTDLGGGKFKIRGEDFSAEFNA